MTAEKVIHASIFFLLLAGLTVLSVWASYTYLHNVILVVASIALSWGIILLGLYVGFKFAGWKWWS